MFLKLKQAEVDFFYDHNFFSPKFLMSGSFNAN